MKESAPPITQVEMSDEDIEFAEKMATQLGYTQTAYTSTSALWGLFLLRDNPEYSGGYHAFRNSDPAGFDGNCSVCGGKSRDSVHNLRLNFRTSGCIIKTKEFGFLFVADLEDLQLHELHAEATGQKARVE